MADEQAVTATIRCSGSPSCACPWHYPEGWKPEPACIVDDEGGVCGRDECPRCGDENGSYKEGTDND